MPGRHPRAAARLAGAVAAVAATLGLPSVAAAHGLSPAYQSPLPLAVYLAGAATTVALSFLFVLARDMRAAPVDPPRVRPVPLVVRLGLRAIGLLGWAWILAQGIAGGSSDAAVAGLFLWVYGWVGIAMLSALVFPVWEWLDPFATLFDLGAWALRRVGVRGWTASPLPRALRVWPALAGFSFFAWLELVAVPGADTLTVVLAGYTVLTLALMAQFGRDTWRAHGEVFTVWFRTLNRLAAIGVAPSTAPDAAPDAVDDRSILRRAFASGLLDAEWELPRIALVAVATATIIFDGLSQTVAFASVFGAPALVPKTLLLLAFLALVAAASLAVAGAVTRGAIGAGLLPISVGYLVAHYLTYLLFDGQRIVIAISDPFQQGSDLFGTAFFKPATGWLPAGMVWTVQLAAVVGGHMLGAWAGHVRAQLDLAAEADRAGGGARRGRPGARREATGGRRNVRVREIPLALVMVALTTLTLWSLGQAIVVETTSGQETAPAGPAAGPVAIHRAG